MSFEEIISSVKHKCGEEAILEQFPEVIQPYALANTSQLLEICKELQTNPDIYIDHLSCITGIDNGVEKGTTDVIYHFYSITKKHHFILKVTVNRDGSELIPSLTPIWGTANWHEREVYDLLGLRFENHPDLRRILLPTNWEGFPLKKDYEAQDYYHGIKVDY